MTPKAAGARALEIAQELIRCPSITPREAGALDYLHALLDGAGFACHRLPFAEKGQPEVDNLFARIGEGEPHLCFAGHTDVVPPGDAAAWTHPPFAGHVADGWLWGRGACDMKGAIACFVAAALDWLGERDGGPPGSLSLLITGDEEGMAVNGTAKAIDWMGANGHTPSHCLLGEPSNPTALGEAIKIGRRGSLNAVLTVTGRQGHVAYPEQAANPIPGLLAVLNTLEAMPLDDGTDLFAPSNLEVTGIDVGNPTPNVIPARARALFNIRYNDRHSAASLEARIRAAAAAALAGLPVEAVLEFQSTGDCFFNPPGPFDDALAQAVQEATGRVPELSTAGGTSDGRFIHKYCPAIEFGHVNATIHQVDERVSLADMDMLTDIYRRFIGRYFAAFAGAAGQ